MSRGRSLCLGVICKASLLVGKEQAKQAMTASQETAQTSLTDPWSLLQFSSLHGFCMEFDLRATAQGTSCSLPSLPDFRPVNCL